MDEVILWAGDPYSAGIAENEQNWQGERVPMELERELAEAQEEITALETKLEENTSRKGFSAFLRK